MTIKIRCECGNEVTLYAGQKRTCVARDQLETKGFKYGGETLKNGKLQKIRVICLKCGNDIDLDFD